MIQKDLQITSNCGKAIFAHIWEPSISPKAAITLVHGFGEHCLRYTPYFEYLVNQGFAIFGFDLIGHGQSEGKRGVIQSYNALLNDIELALNKSKEFYPDCKHFIYGQSMGGNLAMNFLLQQSPDVRGAIITSPWLELTNEPNFLLKIMLALLKNIIPNATINSGLNANHISSDKSEVEKYRNDKLIHGRISFKLFQEIARSGLWAASQAHKIKIPLLLMHGIADQITSPLVTKQVYQSNKSLIEYIEWENKYHELHNETNRSEIAATTINWLNKQL